MSPTSRHRWIAITALLVFTSSASLTLTAQEPAPAHHVQLVHLVPDTMDAQDSNTLQVRQSELIQTARIYGYNLEAGSWTYEQTLCAPMPQTILLHYRQIFPDGTESLFTALVPRGSGRVRIVPVLYRNATPFVPAPKNPRNVALFNELVPREIAAKALAPDGNWLELGACYAEMTGARINLPRGSTIRIGVADAPSATIHLDPQTRTSRITFADRATQGAYRIWTIALDRQGRVAAASTQDYPVYVAKAATSVTGVSIHQPPPASRLEPESTSATAAIQPKPGIPTPPVSTASPVYSAPATQQPAVASLQPVKPQPVASEETDEAGWKFIPQAPPPPSKIAPQGPPPPSKIIPNPPDPWD